MPTISAHALMIASMVRNENSSRSTSCARDSGAVTITSGPSSACSVRLSREQVLPLARPDGDAVDVGVEAQQALRDDQVHHREVSSNNRAMASGANVPAIFSSVAPPAS